MSNLIKPSLTMLPMEDIAIELKSEKENRRFLTKDDKASDVKQVAGVNSDTIAIAVSSQKRTTVDNALNLAGIPASEYLNKAEGERIIGISNVMSEIYSSEIQSLRDEYMQLNSQLIKNGFITNDVQYEGFIDPFKKSNIKYQGYICGLATAINGITDSLYINDLQQLRYFEKGKMFVIRMETLDVETVVTSLGVNLSGKVTFYPSVNMLDSYENVGLYKTNGEYIRDSFSFSTIKKDVPNPTKERYHMQSDDTSTIAKDIKSSNTGYAVCFKINDSAAGALTKFNVKAKYTGHPGALVCHVLDNKALTITDSEMTVNFNNIEDAKKKGLLIASSQPVLSNDISDSPNYQEIVFDFYDGVENKYPKVEGKRYLFIIECLSATELDYWSIVFSYYQNKTAAAEDLQRYNTSYFYKKILDNDVDHGEYALSNINDINSYDLFFSLVTKELIEESEVGKQDGIYTAKIVLPNPIDVSRIRLTARVNREGRYYIESKNDESTLFTINKEYSTTYSHTDTKLKEDDIVIIGNQIAKVKRASLNNIETKTPVYLDNRLSHFYSKNIYNAEKETYEKQLKIPVYRMNYEVFIKPSYIDWTKWDTEKLEFKTTDLVEEPLKLELKNIIPDGNIEKSSMISDRLLFECNFGVDSSDIAKKANEFEVQIHWKSPFTTEEINNFEDNNIKELVGRLHDIILTFDKNY